MTGGTIAEDQSSEAPAAQKRERFLTCQGLKFPIDKSVLPRSIRRSLRLGAYEVKEALAAQKFMRKDDVVLELGGGIGFMSTLISKKTHAKSVHVFEANPNLIPYIHRVHKANDVQNVDVTHAVLGKEAGETAFYIRDDFLASSLDPMGNEEDKRSVQVPVKNVNEALKTVSPTVLVCDIEGAEADLLPIMNLSGLRAVLIELHPQLVGKEGIRKVFRALDDAGLVMFPRWSVGKVAVFRSDW